ncbi:MAG: hypothetical protein M1837_004176 [Sclerophora amabilis]|nr:MAG: hypothetical protein M1837_004176 [Sclerophora amabilis]
MSLTRSSMNAAWPAGSGVWGNRIVSTPSLHGRQSSPKEDRSICGEETALGRVSYDPSLDLEDDEEDYEDEDDLDYEDEEELDMDRRPSLQVIKEDVAVKVNFFAPGKPKLIVITVTPLQTPPPSKQPSINESFQPHPSRCSSVYSELSGEPFQERQPPFNSIVNTTARRHKDYRRSSVLKKPVDGAVPDLFAPAAPREPSARLRPETPPRSPTSTNASSFTSTPSSTRSDSPSQSRLRDFARAMTFAKRKAHRSERVYKDVLGPPPPQLQEQHLLPSTYFTPTNARLQQQSPLSKPPSPPTTLQEPQSRRMRRKSSALTMALSNRFSFMIGEDNSRR